MRNFAGDMTDRQFQHEYERLYMPLGMYALRILEDIDEAEDVVQGVFTEMWQMIVDGSLPEIANFKAYAYRAVRNAALNRVGRQDRFIPIDSADEDVAADDIDTSERDARLWHAIDQLPWRCREVFLLSKRDGMSHSEISAELGISEKTVENQITKAFKRLRGDSALMSGNVFFLPFL